MTTSPNEHKPSALETLNSLTGFEEIAIEKHLNIDPYADGERKPLKVLRALVFVLATRSGMDAPRAREHAMGMPMTEVNAQFSDEADDIDPEDPETEAGKGSSLVV